MSEPFQFLHCSNYIRVETDGTVPGSTITLIGPGDERHVLGCVVSFEGNGERLEVPGADAAGDVITLRVRGFVRRVPSQDADR